MRQNFSINEREQMRWEGLVFSLGMVSQIKVGERFPAPMGEGFPAPMGEGFPAPMGEGFPTPMGEGFPAPMGEGFPAPMGQVPTTSSGNEDEIITIEHLTFEFYT